MRLTIADYFLKPNTTSLGALLRAIGNKLYFLSRTLGYYFATASYEVEKIAREMELGLLLQ